MKSVNRLLSLDTLNLSSTVARLDSNSGESRNSHGRIGCRNWWSESTFTWKNLRKWNEVFLINKLSKTDKYQYILTFPDKSNPSLSVLVKFCMA